MTDAAMLDLHALAQEPLDPELLPYVRDDSVLGPFVKHPLVYGSLAVPGFLNRQLAQKRERLEKARDEGDWPVYLWLHERPHRMTALGELYRGEAITVAQLRVLLPDTWSDTELPYQFGALPRLLFQAAGFVTDAPNIWKVLPDSLIVYRGSTYKPTARAISWTLARGMGEWYARRFNRRHGKLWRGEVEKRHVLGYLEGRGEAEVVVCPRRITGIHIHPMGDGI